MAGLAVPIIEAAAVELGPVLVRAGAALLGGLGLAGTASLSSDTPKDDTKAKTDARTIPRTGEKCNKCPPEQTGRAERTNHHMTAASREYQGRITGRPYSVAEGWSEEWIWLGTDFDGFVPAECLLQEAKGGYGQFLEFDEDADELRPVSWFKGFRKMTDTIMTHSSKVKANPPTRLRWYFQDANAREYMLKVLVANGVESVVQP